MSYDVDKKAEQDKDTRWKEMKEMQKKRGVKVYWNTGKGADKHRYFVAGLPMPQEINKETLIKFEPMSRLARRTFLKSLDNI